MYVLGQSVIVSPPVYFNTHRKKDNNFNEKVLFFSGAVAIMILKIYFRGAIMKSKEYRKTAHYLQILKSQMMTKKSEIQDVGVCFCGYKESNTPPPLDSFKPFLRSDEWGGNDCHAWFHFTLGKTEENEYFTLETGSDVYMTWNAANPQFIVYANGKMIQGMDTYHRECYIGEAEGTDVYVYAYIGAYRDKASFVVDTYILNTEIKELYYDILYPFQMLKYLGLESAEFSQIKNILYRTVSLLEMNEVGSGEFAESVREARKYIAKALYTDYCRELTASTVCIGHTHIDCAWKWTFRQSREKVQRSFSTVMALMKRYPEYKFMMSQPLLYKYIKEEAPEIYEQIKEKVREKRWECEGAMWVEADCNITSGESLVRQILFAKNFFKKEFGVDSRIMWLPDVFGYSAALPQILKKSGVDWFVTSKISWNETNRMPYDTFFWEGIDGSKINCQFITAQPADRNPSITYGGYNYGTDADIIYGAYKRYTQKNLSSEVMMPFGRGDGGGGPTMEHLELLRRGARGIPGNTNVRMEFLGEFLPRLARKIENNPQTPTWQGELYLEFHRGTYTSVAKNKKNNRYCEFLYADAEWLSVMAKELLGIQYPKEKLHSGWEEILNNQFHDVIPGSSIKEVYDQCDIDYGWVKRDGEEIVSEVKSRIASSLDEKHGYVVFNPHSFVGDGYAELDGKCVKVLNAPPKGYRTVNTFIDSNNVKYDGRSVETDVIKVVFDESYGIASIFDKINSREVLKKGGVANELRLYADRPDNHDAWEWLEYSRDSYKSITAFDSVETIDGGARFGIRITRSFYKSKIVQTLWFYDGISKIDFETYVDWHTQHNMLKAAFPVDINSSRATYEIQFGTIERPTHFNTSWDTARFEVCAQKYADISEGNYGVSILNDCKYGHDIHGGVIQLSLLRGTTDPDEAADMGEHTFTYSIYLHSGDLNSADTAQQAYLLNYPMTLLRTTGKGDSVPSEYSLIKVDCTHVMCETVKEEENAEGTVFRLYEYKNMHGKLDVEFGFPVRRAVITDMMENEIEEIEVHNSRITLGIKPFEIVTVKACK